MCDQAVEVFIVWSLNPQVTTANVVDGFIVNHEAAVGVLESGVGGQDGVVWLNDRGSDLGCWVDAEFELALLAIVDGQALHQEGAESGTSASTE